MNYETVCNPVPGAEVDGLTSFATRTAQSSRHAAGVTAENAATILMHLALVHGLREGR
jgi:hypothetical protein